MRAEARYLDLLEQTLTHTAYTHLDIGRRGRNPATRRALRIARRAGVIPLRITDADREQRDGGRDWPVFAHTMVGVKRLHDVRQCVETVIADDIPGDLIEARTTMVEASFFSEFILRGAGAGGEAWPRLSLTAVPGCVVDAADAEAVD